MSLRDPSLSGVVDRLESAGHVERRRHPSDRRRLVVVPTEQVFKAGQEAFSPLEVGLEEVAGELTDEGLLNTLLVGGWKLLVLEEAG